MPFVITLSFAKLFTYCCLNIHVRIKHISNKNFLIFTPSNIEKSIKIVVCFFFLYFLFTFLFCLVFWQIYCTRTTSHVQNFDVTTYTANGVARISSIFSFIFLVRVLVVFLFSTFFYFHIEFLLGFCCDFLSLEYEKFIFRELD